MCVCVCVWVRERRFGRLPTQHDSTKQSERIVTTCPLKGEKYAGETHNRRLTEGHMIPALTEMFPNVQAKNQCLAEVKGEAVIGASL